MTAPSQGLKHTEHQTTDDPEAWSGQRSRRRGERGDNGIGLPCFRTWLRLCLGMNHVKIGYVLVGITIFYQHVGY